VRVGAEVLFIRTVGRILAKNGGHADKSLHFGAADLAAGQGRVAHLLLDFKNVAVFLALILIGGHGALLYGLT
jgi:hypothetical protein